MSKILHKCLSVVLVVMLLASLQLGGTINASADNKTGDGLATYAMRAYNEGWSYVWGGASPGAVDCSGLIYSYVEGGERTTEGMLNASPESGYVSDGVPDIAGLGLWQPGHVGVYVGDGMAVDARDEISNVCYQSVATKSWVMWFKVDGVSYGTDSSVTNDNQSDDEENELLTDTFDNNSLSREYLSQGSSGYEVAQLQERLKELGYFNENITLYFGPVTEAALIEFQTDAGLTPDGVYNDATKSVLTAENAPSKLVNTFDSTDNEDELLTVDSEENVNIPTDDDNDSDSEIDSAIDLPDENSQEDEKTLSTPETQLSEKTDVNSDENNKNSETSSSNEVVFTYGDVDDGVSNVQYILIKLGYYHDEMTGIYDEKTFNAVEFFQLDNSLPATGSVDEETLEAMFSAFNEKYAQPEVKAEENDAAEETADTDSFEQTEAYEQPKSAKLSFQPSNSTETPAQESESNDETLTAITENEELNEEITAEDTENNTDSPNDSETLTETTDTDSEQTTSSAEITSDNTDNSSDSPKSEATQSITSGGTNVPTSASSVDDAPKSPKTGDPIIMSVQSLIEYLDNYVDTALIISLAVITIIGIFFAGTIHYWNVSMEKRKQRAKKATTVSVYRRSSM